MKLKIQLNLTIVETDSIYFGEMHFAVQIRKIGFFQLLLQLQLKKSDTFSPKHYSQRNNKNRNGSHISVQQQPHQHSQQQKLLQQPRQ